MNKPRKILNLQILASKKGQLERRYTAASPSERVIIQIALAALTTAITNESRGLRQLEWRSDG